jgi:small neutral amino acid transporter SnatA (MarC family)
VIGAGALITWGLLCGVAWASGPLLDAVEITPETFRIAAGLVAVAAGLVVLFSPRPAAEPELAGMRAAVWPVAFPRLFAPEVAALALSTGSLEGVAATAAGSGVVLSLVVAAAVAPRTPVSERVMLWTGRVLAALLVAVGIFLMVEGIRDV